MSRDSTIADGWLTEAAEAAGGTIRRDAVGAGLLSDFSALDGPLFRASDVTPQIRDFYEHTSRWRMEVWTQWNPLLQPAGLLIAHYFGRRVKQLMIPTRPLEVAQGMDSEVVAILDGEDRQQGAAWIRTLRSTGAYVYSGYYRTTTLRGTSQPSVHVAFPLQFGNLQVFLRPRALPDGSLELLSTAGRFGTDGAYVVVAHRSGTHAARVALHERFHLYLDGEGTLRTDHVIRFRSTPAVRLHYKLEQRR